MGWLITAIANVFLEACNELLAMFMRIIVGFNLDIGYKVDAGGGVQTSGMLDNIIPFAKNFMPLFLGAGLSICLLVYIARLILCLAPFGADKRSPLRATGQFISAFLFTGLSYEIFIAVELLASKFYNSFKQMFSAYSETFDASDDVFDMVNLLNNDELYATQEQEDSFIAMILVFAFLLALTINLVKMIMEMFERYVLLGVMFYTSPLAFSTLSTDDRTVFKSWVQMLISQFILMMTNLFFLTTFAGAFANIIAGTGTPTPMDTNGWWTGSFLRDIPVIGLIGDVETGIIDWLGNTVVGWGAGIGKAIDGTGACFANETEFIITMSILNAWLICGQKLDQHLKGLGLSAAQTGGGLGYAIMGAATTGLAVMSMGARMLARPLAKGAKLGGKKILGSAGGTTSAAPSGILGKFGSEKAGKAEVKSAARMNGQLTKEGSKQIFNSKNRFTQVQGKDAEMSMRNMGIHDAHKMLNVADKNGNVRNLSDLKDPSKTVFGAGEMKTYDKNGNLLTHIGKAEDFTSADGGALRETNTYTDGRVTGTYVQAATPDIVNYDEKSMVNALALSENNPQNLTWYGNGDGTAYGYDQNGEVAHQAILDYMGDINEEAGKYKHRDLGEDYGGLGFYQQKVNDMPGFKNIKETSKSNELIRKSDAGFGKFGAEEN